MHFEVNSKQAVQEAIAALCRFLDGEGLSKERVFDSRLVASELLGNIFKHTDGVARLKSRVQNGFVEIAVWSSVASTSPTQSTCADVYAEHGRGLFLIDRVCEERSVSGEGEVIVRIRI